MRNFNLGYNQANPIINVVKIIEKHMGKKALIDFTDNSLGRSRTFRYRLLPNKIKL